MQLKIHLRQRNLIYGWETSIIMKLQQLFYLETSNLNMYVYLKVVFIIEMLNNKNKVFEYCTKTNQEYGQQF